MWEKTIENWNLRIYTKNKLLETEIEGEKKNFRIIETGGNHVAIEIEKKKLKEEEIFFTKGEEEKLDTFKAIRKVHEVTNHKSAEQLIIAYRNAGLMGPGKVKMIKQVVRDCKICQKILKSMVKPKVKLPKAGSFNEIVTLDLKQFGNRYILWC